MWVGWDWSLTMRKAKEAVGLERRRPQGDPARLLGVCHGLTLMLCRSRRASLQSRWEHWPGKEPQSSALCCVPSPSVAGRHLSPRGKRCSWGSRGQCAASLLWKRENALTGLSTGEMVSSQEYNLQGKTKKCPLRFPFSFKQKIIIIKKKSSEPKKIRLFPLSGKNVCLLPRSDPETLIDLRGLWVRCQDGLNSEIFASLSCKAEVQPVTYPLASPKAAGDCFSSSRAAAGEGIGIQQTFHQGHRFRN